MTTPITFTYEERQAMTVIRKMLKRKPEAASVLFEGMAKEVAASVLLQAKCELATLLSVTQAITAAAGQIAKLEKSEV